MKTTLVTGCAGFIGSSLVDHLLDINEQVIGIDNFNDFYDPEIKRKNLQRALKNKNFHLITKDILQIPTKDFSSTLENVDSIVHLAASPGVRQSFVDSSMFIQNNISALNAILKLSSSKTKLIVASSSSVYGTTNSKIFNEELFLQPISVYGATKACGEDLCRAYSNNYKIDITCLRIFTCYGPRQRPDLAIHRFSKELISKNSLTVYGNGFTTRDYTYVSDIIDGIILARDKANGFNVINLGSGNPVFLADVIKEIAYNLDIENYSIINEEMPLSDMVHTHAGISKAKKLLGWFPKIDFKVGIKNFIDWFKNQQ
jgi:UDP-glucuronate 4-epimerase